MSARDRSFYLKLQRRAGRLSPDIASDLLAAYRTIRESLSAADLERLIASGQLEQIIDDALLDRALLPLRERIVKAVEKGFRATVPDLPKQGKIDGQLAVSFDQLNPRVIDAVRQLDSRVVNTLNEGVRDTVRAFVENGIRDGKGPREIARQLRSTIGMSPTQAENLVKYEAKLRALKRNPLTESQIAKRLATYERKAVAQTANTVSHTATLDSLKLGQRLSWDDAVAKGIVDPSRLFKRWVTVGDDRVRPEHQAMNGEVVQYDQYFSNGEMEPGESTFGCRCVAIYFVKRQTLAMAA